ncbi:hypothetical protein HNQ92_001934 [Rhabdobacter roseus]|uniref:Uncharacterized protein n=1 Tax=Rhabdobacter roseus TaxID=1655419 RepID=A0A840TUR6_9BACT|nr:hypothetical protein [Rhabdobacter roseus]MBB5283808.1 hypothetical protein [Rhabdobacter roseus]
MTVPKAFAEFATKIRLYSRKLPTYKSYIYEALLMVLLLVMMVLAMVWL